MHADDRVRIERFQVGQRIVDPAGYSAPAQPPGIFARVSILLLVVVGGDGQEIDPLERLVGPAAALDVVSVADRIAPVERPRTEEGLDLAV